MNALVTPILHHGRRKDWGTMESHGEPRQMADGATTMAFQPIADTGAGRVYAYEAVLRGSKGLTVLDLRATMSAEDPRSGKLAR